MKTKINSSTSKKEIANLLLRWREGNLERMELEMLQCGTAKRSELQIPPSGGDSGNIKVSGEKAGKIPVNNRNERDARSCG